MERRPNKGHLWEENLLKAFYGENIFKRFSTERISSKDLLLRKFSPGNCILRRLPSDRLCREGFFKFANGDMKKVFGKVYKNIQWRYNLKESQEKE